MKIVAIYLCAVSLIFFLQGNTQLGIVFGVVGCFTALNEHFSS